MPAHVLGQEGAATGAAALGPNLAGQAIKPHLIHEAVVAELAWRRAGTHSTKTRSDVRGGGKKPWRQKGTGRARQGSTRAPQWVGGGVVFGPTPRSYGGKVNRKAHVQAFRSAVRAHADRGSMAVMEPTGWDEPSTKRAAAYLDAAPEGIAARPLVVVVTEESSAEALSFRNLRDVTVLEARDVETVDVMAGRALLVQREVWERWSGGPLEIDASVPAAPARPKPEKRAKPEPPAPAPAEAEAEAEPEAEEGPVVVAGAEDAEPAAEASEPEAPEAEAEPVAEAAEETEPEAEEDAR